MWQALEERSSPGVNGSRTLLRGRLINRQRSNMSGRWLGCVGQDAWFGGSRGALPLSSTLLLALKAKLSALVEAMSGEVDPGFRPSVIALSSAQGQHRIDMRPSPTHARAFEARLHDLFVRTFHHA